LIGNAVGGGTLGTVAGGVGGGLLGRHLDKKNTRSRNGC
jgi:Na+/glutamate symporter